MPRLTVAKRFNGPPDSGNGGYVAGRLAAHAGQPAEVTLRAPPPLERELAVVAEPDGAVALLDGGMRIAEARAAALDLDPPDPPDLAEARRAAERYTGFETHVFPTCFVCGPARDEGDGLCIFPGPVAPGRVAAPWVPHTSLADAAGRVRPEFCWAALDCPGVFALGTFERPIVLGRLTAEITAPVRAGEPHVVVGWSIRVEGRKHTTGTALFDAKGALVGRALGTWIELAG